MERLTEWTANGPKIRLNDSTKNIIEVAKENALIFKNAYEKLAKYEDAEEQREKGCAFCKENLSLFDYGDITLYIDGENGCISVFDHSADAFTVEYEIKLCPMCGRKLRE